MERRALVGSSLGAALIVTAGLTQGCSSNNSACNDARNAGSSYLADYQVGTNAAAEFKNQVDALPSYPSSPPLDWVTRCDEYAPGPIIPADQVRTNCPASAISATIDWEKSLQAEGVGTDLRLGADPAAVNSFVNAVAVPEIAKMNAIRSAIPQGQRSTDVDAKLYDAVVDGNPTCFSAEVRAQVKVNEGS